MMASARPSVALTMILGVLTIVTWWWQERIFRGSEIERRWESPLDHITNEVPSFLEVPEVPMLSPQVVESVVRANPFSPERRHRPPQPEEGAKRGSEAVVQQPQPQFTYKGRINLGKQQRAIVEDVRTRKTYFLEVGQEVAGFKVLDIAENRVVLSDLQTTEEVVVSLTSPPSP